jgi:hypothetical protein
MIPPGNLATTTEVRTNDPSGNFWWFRIAPTHRTPASLRWSIQLSMMMGFEAIGYRGRESGSDEY